jgi:ligand-binding SRPBCC domain-containing protein
MKQYRHRFQVYAPLRKVIDFHSHPQSMGAITPPPIIARMQRAPAVLEEGDEMEFTLWVGPLPLRWLALIENVSAEGFTDRQLRGPFQAWEHRHQFAAINENTTEIIDIVNGEVRKHWFWGFVGLAMWVGLPGLFAYRAWKTQKILHRQGLGS